MTLAIDAAAALWFAPFVLPICFYVCWTDMAMMRITNPSVIALALVFVTVGLLALPLDVYPWRLATMAGVLVLGVVLNAAGVMGAGDAKFTAAAAGFIDPGDIGLLMLVFSSALLAGFTTHRLAKRSPLRALVPHWESWHRKKDFPMGLALGATLAIYMLLGIFLGS